MREVEKRKEIYCMFIGHSFYPYADLRKKIEEIVENLIVNEGVNCFLDGWHGDFDILCRDICYDLKKKYPYIKILKCLTHYSHIVPDLCAPDEDYDSTLWFDLGTVYPKAIITERNKQMVDCSHFIVCGIRKNYGGAYKTYRYAKKQNKTLIEL
ncbi:MAG: hypothetical protein J6J24_01565 [Clostridia bacterium]|nr:hypothetical protein [Clostridia bacterium]